MDKFLPPQIYSKSPTQRFNTREVLGFLEKSLEASLLLQVQNIENLFMTELKRLVPDHEQEHIKFAVEVVARTFVFKPFNLFTYMLSEGEYVPYEEVSKYSRYQTEAGLYVFDALTETGIFVKKS